MRRRAIILGLLAGLAGTGGMALADPTPRHHRAPATTGEHDEASTAATESEHVVKPGETLGGIANRAHVPRVLIAEANHLKKPYHVHAGQRLFLPRTRHHTVKPGETGFGIAMRYGVPFSSIAVANGLKPDAPLVAGQRLLVPTLIPPPEDTGAAKPPVDTKPDTTSPAGPADDADDTDASTGKPSPAFAWPLAGKVVRGFVPRGQANHHDGYDIVAPAGTVVRASASGTVVFAGEEPQSFGKLVVINHGHNWQTAYGFLGRLTVAQGDTVSAHERLGVVGHSGKATRDELHFEMRHNKKPVDPGDSLPAASAASSHEAASKPQSLMKPQTKAKPKPRRTSTGD